MSLLYVWTLILGLMAMVLAMRWSFLVLPRRFQPKGALARALNFAPLAALIAICAPEILKHQTSQLVGAQVFTILNDWRLWGAIAMLAVAGLSRGSKSATLYGLIAAAVVVWWL
jgi:branched-subunit amino acid transport protein